MNRTQITAAWTLPAAVLLAVVVSAARPVGAEVIESIVARINDDIITSSELKETEQQAVADIYSHHAGEDLDKELARTKTELLKEMITRKILVQQAERLYDLSKMEDSFVREFKESNKISSTPELEKLLKDEGMTLAEFKKKLIEINAPGSVIQYEVRDKVSVSDGEIEAYYKAHGQEMASAERASYRELVLMAEGRSRDETLASANALVTKARAGADFVELAKESSQVEPRLRGVLLGPFRRGELAPDVEKAVFGMKASEIAEPVEIGPAVHIIRLESREESVLPSLDSMKEKISNIIEHAKFDAALQEYILGLWRRSEVHVDDEYVERIPLDYRKFLK